MKLKHACPLFPTLFWMGVLHAQTIRPVFDKEWNFQCNGGTVKVGLNTGINSLDPQISSLTITCHGATPSSKDEAEFLEQVVNDMEKSGIPPGRICAIYSHICEPEISKKLSLSAYHSSDWAKAERSGYASLIVKLLNANDACSVYNEVFAKYGLKAVIESAYYITLVSPVAIGLPAKGSLQVPSSASISIALRPGK